MPITKVSVGTSATLILAEAERKAFIVSNIGASTIYLSIGGEASVTLPAGARPGLPLNAGDRIAVSQDDRRSIIPNQAVYGIVASGTVDVAVETIL